jgi:hypothetical protein
MKNVHGMKRLARLVGLLPRLYNWKRPSIDSVAEMNKLLAQYFSFKMEVKNTEGRVDPDVKQEKANELLRELRLYKCTDSSSISIGMIGQNFNVNMEKFRIVCVEEDILNDPDKYPTSIVVMKATVELRDEDAGNASEDEDAGNASDNEITKRYTHPEGNTECVYPTRKRGRDDEGNTECVYPTRKRGRDDEGNTHPMCEADPVIIDEDV